MISSKHIKEINKAKLNKNIERILPIIIFIVTFVVSYIFKVDYNENTSLFIDKLIDVSSIFFGVFIGSAYLFSKIKESYKEFLNFCKNLLFQNLSLIFLSFFIILFSDKIPNQILLFKDYLLNLKVFVFSIYIAFFNLVLWNIYRFIKILMSEK